MQRRSFLLWAAGGTAAAAAGGAAWRWQEIAARARYPGRAEGHFLRAAQPLPAPVREIDTDIVILGSGIAGLTAAWKLQKEGHRDHLIIDGPQPDGNAAGGAYGALAYPTGAHYLPLPSQESAHVREILHDLGILLRNPDSAAPYYDERALLHGPHERLLVDGRWQEGLLPETIGPSAAAGPEAQQQSRFLREVERFKALRGADGRRLFVFPTALSSRDPAWDWLDRISFATWLERNGYTAPGLLWYLNYGCRDDFGATAAQVSAWAGLYYFCSRDGQAENADRGAWLTWPGGLQTLASGLRQRAGGRTLAGTAAVLRHAGQGIEADCFMLVDGKPEVFRVRARRAICAMPLAVASRVVEDIAGFGFDPKTDVPQASSWMVANFLMRRFPQELPEAPLSWDNVVRQEPGLGYVVSTHQDIRVRSPEQTVFSAYVALSHLTPAAARAWLDRASVDELLQLASADLRSAYGAGFAQCVRQVDITVRGHAMAIPAPGFRTNRGRNALRDTDGPILFAHADLSGFSVFEEASWWGYRAALRALGKPLG